MKNFKIFVATLFIVIIIGTIILFIFGEKNTNNKIENNAYEDELAIKNDKSEEINNNNEIEEIIIKDLSTISSSNLNNKENNCLSENSISEDSCLEETLSADTINYEEMYANEKNTKIIYPSSTDKLTISFAGDILFDPGYAIYSAYKQRGCDINQCFSADLLDKMRSADIMMVNNEFPYSDRGAPLENKTYTFRAATSSVSTLEEMGVDIVSIANNHTYDYGPDAFMDTLTTLENAGMPYVGAGRNIEDAAYPYYFICNGKKIAFLSATQIERNGNPDTKPATETTAGVFRCMDSGRLIEEIKSIKDDCDFIILYVHWGTESTDQLDSYQTKQALEYVEAGVDIIIGDHPHVLQEINYVNGVPVIYSLGNYWFNSRTLDSCIVTLTLDTSKEDVTIDKLQFEPCLQSNMSVKLLHDDEKKRVLDYMRIISDNASFDEEGFVTEKFN